MRKFEPDLKLKTKVLYTTPLNAQQQFQQQFQQQGQRQQVLQFIVFSVARV